MTRTLIGERVIRPRVVQVEGPVVTMLRGDERQTAAPIPASRSAPFYDPNLDELTAGYRCGIRVVLRTNRERGERVTALHPEPSQRARHD